MSAQTQWELLDALEKVRHFCRHIFVRVELVIYSKARLLERMEQLSIPQLIDEVVAAGEEAGFRGNVVEPLLAKFINAELRDARKVAKQPPVFPLKKDKPHPARAKLIKLIQGREAAITKSLAAIPSGMEKGLTALEHGCSIEPDPEALALLGPGQDGRWKSQVAEMRRRLFEDDHPTPPSEISAEYHTAVIRFYEDFEPIDAKALIKEIARDIVGEAELGATMIPLREDHLSTPWEMFRTLYLYWIYSRSRNLRYRLVPAASKLMGHIESWQERSGAWLRHVAPHLQRPAENKEDAVLTALAIQFFVRYGDMAEHQQSIEKAKRWLLANASPSGGWRNPVITDEESDVLATVVALDALRRVGAPADHPAIQEAEGALIRWQHPTGYWEIKKSLVEFPTVIAVEYLRSRSARGTLPNAFLLSGRSLVARAENLVLSDIRADARLAVIAAFHGLEHVLYGWLLVKDDKAEIFRGNETCGFRPALKMFEDLAQREIWIGADKGLPFRTQLQMLATNRDHIVHQGVLMSIEDAEKHIGVVRQFIRRFEDKALGFPLLD